jgi:hypothetical protein
MPPRRRSVPEPRESGSQPKRPRRSIATSPEGRENQLVALAMDLAERQMEDGTASAQVISHWLKAGSSRERLEQERLRHENALLEVKREAILSQQRMEEGYKQVLKALRSYNGYGDEDDENG